MSSHPLGAVRDGGVLVVGGTGFLGVHVLMRALATGRTVACASRNTRMPAGIRGAEAVRALEIELAARGRARELVETLAPAIVIACAAQSRIHDCEREPELARRLNVDLPRELAEACARRDVRLVHVSTDLVFGARRAPPGGFRAGDAVGPVSIYGRTKAEGESAVLAAHPAALVVRLPLLYGESFGRGLGASDSLIDAVRRGERPVLFTDEWRTPLDVADAARALVEQALTSQSGILHVPGPARLSRHELGVLVLRRAGIDDPQAHLTAQTRAGAGMADRPEDVSLAANVPGQSAAVR